VIFAKDASSSTLFHFIPDSHNHLCRDRGQAARRWRPLRWRRLTGKKIGDAWDITGKAYVDRTTAALRYYGLPEYQGVGKERE
jgi:hypothetical protein